MSFPKLTERWISRTSIDNLPDDVLRLILLFGIDPHSLCAHRLSSSTTAIRLVSRLWDMIVTSSPRLWSHIHIAFNESKTPVPPLTTLSHWIALSAEVSLSIELSLSHEGRDHETRFIRSLDILSTAIHRWHSLRLHLSIRSSESISNAIQKYDLARAAELDFANVTLRCAKTDKMDQIIRKLSLAPSLRHLRWAPCNIRCAYAMTSDFPLERLASLYLGFYVLPFAIDVLRKCTSAEHITLYFPQPGVEHFVPATTEPIYLHNLRVIEIVVMELDSPFLTLLHAPRLSVLCVNYTDFFGHGSPPASSPLPAKLKEMLKRCPSLQVLIINSLPYTEISTVIRAPELQNLRVLEIIYPDPDKFKDLETALVEEDRKRTAAAASSEVVVDADTSNATAHASPRASKAPEAQKNKKNIQCKPLLDGALLIGWTDPEWDEEFFYIPDSPSVRMCGRTMEWWRIISKYEKKV
ncbi:hypothetical protein D9756_011362 [Leucocoprinus leucothites]|uniref:F-box domain-containing protein n=2 Tax=Leucocoprinus leucothites TaxID=201217 RepID=A0A8H5FPM4_9AGAR|nr:hypothetical protein D9756_011362 [Leucoagaricus leucothites]